MSLMLRNFEYLAGGNNGQYLGSDLNSRISGINTSGTTALTNLTVSGTASIAALSFTNLTVSGDAFFGTGSVLTISGGNIEAAQAETIDIYGGNTSVQGETAGRVRLVAGSNTYLGSGGGGAGGSVVADRGDSQYGGNVQLNGGSGLDDGDGGDIRLSPGVVNGVSPTGKNGRVQVVNGAFRVAVYANAAGRDAAINNPGNGDICFVTTDGLQIYDGGWLTLQTIS